MIVMTGRTELGWQMNCRLNTHISKVPMCHWLQCSEWDCEPSIIPFTHFWPSWEILFNPSECVPQIYWPGLFGWLCYRHSCTDHQTQTCTCVRDSAVNNSDKPLCAGHSAHFSCRAEIQNCIQPNDSQPPDAASLRRVAWAIPKGCDHRSRKIWCCA